MVAKVGFGWSAIQGVNGLVAGCAVGWPGSPRIIGSHNTSVAFFSGGLTNRSLDIATLGYGIYSVWGDGTNYPLITGGAASDSYVYTLDGTTTPALVASQAKGTDETLRFFDVVEFGGDIYVSRWRLTAGYGNSISSVEVWDGASFTTENEIDWGAWVAANNMRCPVFALFNSDIYCGWSVENYSGTGANRIQRRNGGTWDNLTMPGSNWRMRCSAVFGGDLYLGGGELVAGTDSGGQILRVTSSDVVSVARTVGSEKVVSLAVFGVVLYYLYYNSGDGFYHLGSYNGSTWNDSFKAFSEAPWGLYSYVSDDSALIPFDGSLYLLAGGLIRGPADLSQAWTLVDSCGDCSPGVYCFMGLGTPLHDHALAVMT
jgi:hypothetical protein